MRVAQEKVLDFHLKHGLPAADAPTLGESSLAHERYELIREELGEYLAAAAQGNLVGVADALADLAYVVLGTAVVHGIDLQPVFDEVHVSNLTKDKLDPVTRKGGKGPGYKPPRIADLLLIQSTGLQNDWGV